MYRIVCTYAPFIDKQCVKSVLMCHDVSCQAFLDEPTSGLDEEAEAHLFSSLQSSCAAFLSIGRLNWAMFFIDAMAAE